MELCLGTIVHLRCYVSFFLLFCRCSVLVFIMLNEINKYKVRSIKKKKKKKGEKKKKKKKKKNHGQCSNKIRSVAYAKERKAYMQMSSKEQTSSKEQMSRKKQLQIQ